MLVSGASGLRLFFPNNFLGHLVVFLFFVFFLAALGLHCCAWVLSSCGERGLLFIAVHGLLIAVTSLVVEHGL